MKSYIVILKPQPEKKVAHSIYANGEKKSRSWERVIEQSKMCDVIYIYHESQSSLPEIGGKCKNIEERLTCD